METIAVSENDGNLSEIFDRERILVAAWMLPNDGALTDSQRRQAMENFQRYIIRNSITKDEVAHQIGTPHLATISDLCGFKFRDDRADASIRRLNNWVEQHARSRAGRTPDRFVETRVAKAMLDVARLVRENATMGVAVGPTGIGKTRCCLALSEKYVGSIYMRIVGDTHHPRGFTMSLAAKLGVRWNGGQRRGSHLSKLDRVIETLKGSNRFIILDEAGKLSDATIEVVRDIHDTTGVPVLLVGTKDLHDRIRKNTDADHGQLYSRFDVVWDLVQGRDCYSGGRPLYTLDDIRALYNEPTLRLADDAERYLLDVANMLGYGSLRRCGVLIKNAARRARKRLGIEEGEAVTVSACDLEHVEGLLRQDDAERDMAEDRRKRAACLIA